MAKEIWLDEKTNFYEKFSEILQFSNKNFALKILMKNLKLAFWFYGKFKFPIFTFSTTPMMNRLAFR